LLTSLNNRRVPPATCAAGRPAGSRLTLSRQNSLRSQSTVVGARLALCRVSSLMTGSRSPGSPVDASAIAAPSVKTDSEATGSANVDANDEDEEVRRVRLLISTLIINTSEQRNNQAGANHFSTGRSRSKIKFYHVT